MRAAALDESVRHYGRRKTLEGKPQGRNRDEISLAGMRGNEGVERLRKPEGAA
jgi:hypothetical protein